MTGRVFFIPSEALPAAGYSPTVCVHRGMYVKVFALRRYQHVTSQ